MNPETTIDPDAFQITASRGFVRWLISQQVSLAFSTYQTGKLFLVGHNEDGRFSVYDRTFERAMGLAGDGQTIYMATRERIAARRNARGLRPPLRPAYAAKESTVRRAGTTRMTNLFGKKLINRFLRPFKAGLVETKR